MQLSPPLRIETCLLTVLVTFVIHLATVPEERALIKKHSYSDLEELAIFQYLHFF